MEKLVISNQIDVFGSIDELGETEKKLLAVATEAAKQAYAPYSRFFVGAAVLLENDKIVSGNNQENAAYPTGLCAERVALFYASSQYPGQKIVSIAVSGGSSSNNLEMQLSPCGSCRQAIAEYETKFGSPIKIIMPGEKGSIYVCNSISVLLPLMFNSSNLK